MLLVALGIGALFELFFVFFRFEKQKKRVWIARLNAQNIKNNRGIWL